MSGELAPDAGPSHDTETSSDPERSQGASPESARDDSTPDPVAPDPVHGDDGASQTPAPPATLRDRLLAEIGHTEDPPELIDKLEHAERVFEAGNFRACGPLLAVINDSQPSPELSALVHLRMKRTRPDRFLLVFAALCAIGLVAIWILTVGSSH